MTEKYPILLSCTLPAILSYRPVSLEDEKVLACTKESMEITYLIPDTEEYKDHPGLGGYFVDNCLSEEFMRQLDQIFSILPEAVATKIACNSRRYVCDSELWLRQALHNVLVGLGEVFGADTLGSKRAEAFPHMRFLHYTEVGGGLIVHL